MRFYSKCSIVPTDIYNLLWFGPKPTHLMASNKGKQHAPEPSNECMVCTNAFNTTTRTKIACPFCDKNQSACRECTQTYLVGSVLEPHCMQCRHQWSLEFFVNSFNKAFVNTVYRKSRQEIAMDVERGKMAEAMPIVERRRRNKDLDNRIYNIKRQIKELRTQLNDLLNERDHGIPEEREQKPTSAKYLFRCSVGECKGLVIHANWKCGLCEEKYCRKCHNPKPEDHECKEEDIQNAREIMASTKPCPKCGVRIFRSMGCAQMFCVECHTGFNWNSGNIVTGTIHNPHYYELQYRLGHNVARTVGDVPCGGLVDWHSLAPHMNKLDMKVRADLSKSLQSIHRLAGEVSDYLQNALGQKDTIDIRIDYLENKIDDEGLKRRLFIRSRTNDKNREMRNILETFRTSIVERFRHLLETLDAIKGAGKTRMEQRTTLVTNTIEEANKILEFCKNALQTALSLMGFTVMPKLVFGERFVQNTAHGGVGRLITVSLPGKEKTKGKKRIEDEDTKEDPENDPELL